MVRVLLRATAELRWCVRTARSKQAAPANNGAECNDVWREIRDKSRRQVVIKSRTVYETRRRQSVRSVDNLHCAAAGSEQEVALEVARRQGLLQKHPTILLRWNFDGSNQIKEFFNLNLNLKSSTRRETRALLYSAVYSKSNRAEARGLCAVHVQSSPSPIPPRAPVAAHARRVRKSTSVVRENVLAVYSADPPPSGSATYVGRAVLLPTSASSRRQTTSNPGFRATQRGGCTEGSGGDGGLSCPAAFLHARARRSAASPDPKRR